MINKNLANRINRMAAVDKKMRKRVMKTGIFDTRIDKKNTVAMKKIIKVYGWPTINKVGEKASFNAWLLVQHADHNVKFQKKCLNLIKKEYSENPKNISKENIAFLTDRILVHEGKKQIFGTQFYRNKAGKVSPRPIKGKNYLNKRRKIYNLPPFENYKKYIKSFPKTKIIK